MIFITGENEYFLSKHNTDMTDAWLKHDYFSVEDEEIFYLMPQGRRPAMYTFKPLMDIVK